MSKLKIEIELEATSVIDAISQAEHQLGTLSDADFMSGMKSLDIRLEDGMYIRVFSNGDTKPQVYARGGFVGLPKVSEVRQRVELSEADRQLLQTLTSNGVSVT